MFERNTIRGQCFRKRKAYEISTRRHLSFTEPQRIVEVCHRKTLPNHESYPLRPW